MLCQFRRARETTVRFPNPLKVKHLRTRKFAARNDATRMARVSIESAAWEGRHVAALGGSLTCGRAKTTLEEE